MTGEASGGGKAARSATFRDLLAVREFRALWSAQALSVIGDQFARVALTLLVYDRTRSALLAAITFAASVIPTFLGGVGLAGLADRFPRRAVMIICDVLRMILVIAMTLPGVQIPVLIALLFVVTMVGTPFTSARMAIYADVLTGDRYVLGNAITLTTYQIAQVAGFAAGGVLVALVGVRTALFVDAATYGCSALITRVWVAARAVRRGNGGGVGSHLVDIRAGVRLAFGVPVLRTTMLFGWLAAFYNAPEGVAAPLAHSLGGGNTSVGIILAAGALGAAIGGIGLTRLAAPGRRLRWMRPIAFACCAMLGFFALAPPLALALLILFASGLFDCFQVPASSEFVRAAPPEHRSQVFGIAQAGMSLGQGAMMLVAGAAAQHFAPADVIAAIGAIGALAALVIPGRLAGPDYSSSVAASPTAGTSSGQAA
jgi:MFS family permease